MSEVTQPANAGAPDPANADGAAKANPATPDKPDDGQVKISAARLLEESKKWKARALAAEKEKAEADEAKLAEQGKYKEMFERTQTELNAFKSKHVATKKQAEIEKVAAKLGCVSVDALVKLGDSNLVEYDADADAVHGAELFVEEAKKAHPYLFNAAKPPTVNGTTPQSPSNKKLSYAEWLKLPYAEQIKRQHEVPLDD